MAGIFVQTSYKTDMGAAGAGTGQKITITSTGASLSTALSAQARVVRLVSDVPCWITSGGTSATASSTGNASSIFLPGNLVEYKNFDRGNRISVIADGTSGFLSLSEQTQ